MAPSEFSTGGSVVEKGKTSKMVYVLVSLFVVVVVALVASFIVVKTNDYLEPQRITVTGGSEAVGIEIVFPKDTKKKFNEDLKETQFYQGGGNFPGEIRDFNFIVVDEQQQMHVLRWDWEVVASVGLGGNPQEGELTVKLNVKKDRFENEGDLNYTASFLVLKVLNARGVENNGVDEPITDEWIAGKIMEYQSDYGRYPIELTVE